MRSKKFILGMISIFLLSFFSLGVFAAADISVESSVSPVEFSGSCDSADSVLLQVLFAGQTVWVGDAEVSSSVYATTFTATSDGDYTVYVASCGEVESVEFCVGSSCVSTSASSSDDDSEEPSSSSSSSSSSSGSSSSGGSGRGSSYYDSCDESWECTGWSSCGSTLSQSRSCSEQSGCSSENDRPEIERSCDECEESWICGSWTECSGGSQARTCADENSCGSYAQRPDETRSCVEESDENEGFFAGLFDSGSSESSKPKTETVYVQETTFMDPIYTFLINYGLIVGVVVFTLILLIVGIVVLLHYRKDHAPAANMHELHDYVQQEKEAGMTTEQIEQNLGQSGWTKEEVDTALSGLSSVQLLVF